MLDQLSKITCALLFATLSLSFSSAMGQQLPSQRYEPIRNTGVNATPPSVHIPTGQARPLAEDQQSGAGYTFTDSPRMGHESTPLRGGSASVERGMVMQTSYDVDANGEPIVPEILSAPAMRDNQQSTPVFSSEKLSTQISSGSGTKGPAAFEAQMNQIRSTSPKISSGDFQENAAARQEIADFQKQVQARAAAQTQHPNMLTAPPTVSEVAYDKVPASVAVAPKASAEPKTAIAPTALEKPIEKQVSASEFISRLNDANTHQAKAPAHSIDAPTAPKLVAQRIESLPSAREHSVVQTGGTQSNPASDSVRPASAEEEEPQASINLSSPAIAVESFGPQTVGINKPAKFQVVVTNSGGVRAEQILIGIDLPQWVDIENVQLTTGGKEITDGQNQARLLWNVDQIGANSSQTITITAVPRKPEMFDLGVEWTLVPRTGAANIQVTQPRLEMNIVGPEEVLYGEQALYHVTVRNPGTGTAENVTVMLPEALGGERATLGNIAPGKDKNFQVELLARTAGELNLVANAVADGDLKISAERQLTVRRANIGIGIDGPGLKYAGSVGQYMVTVSNSGDATANEVVAAMALPPGVKYLSGIDSVKLIEGGLRWQVGALEPGQTRDYKVNCQLDSSGDLQLEVGAQGKGELQAASACQTTVETVADLVLEVRDPKGPLPTGQNTIYEITVRNRGSRSAKGVNLVMQFSDGIEPKSATGLEHKIVPGQVLFNPISQLDPGQEMSFKVGAEAFKEGKHIYRAQLVCEESDSREIAEGTTRFFGEDMRNSTENTADAGNQFGGGTSNELQLNR